MGLLLIGGVIALLVVPASRFITQRVKRLQASAVHIAEGDLSHRTDVGGKDEIGELAFVVRLPWIPESGAIGA